MITFYNLLSKRGNRDMKILNCYLDPEALVQELQWACKNYSKLGDYMPEISSKELFFKKLESERKRKDNLEPIRVAKLKDCSGVSYLYVDYGYINN